LISIPVSESRGIQWIWIPAGWFASSIRLFERNLWLYRLNHLLDWRNSGLLVEAKATLGAETRLSRGTVIWAKADYSCHSDTPSLDVTELSTSAELEVDGDTVEASSAIGGGSWSTNPSRVGLGTITREVGGRFSKSRPGL
jgi:hypothetical protein